MSSAVITQTGMEAGRVLRRVEAVYNGSGSEGSGVTRAPRAESKSVDSRGSARYTVLAVLFAIVAAGLLCASLRLPLWHLKMEAPQYQDKEALRVHVFPGRMNGDLREIRVLNQYVGVHIPEQLPELRWLPIALAAGAGLGLIAAFLPRRWRSRALFSVAGALTLVLLISAGLAQWQMHEIGHERNHHAALRGVQDFTTPLLGRVKIANFEITTMLGSGAALIALALGLQVGAGFFARKPRVVPTRDAAVRPSVAAGSISHHLEFSI